ncbi:MAG TPA: hypothetical protein VLC95_14245, partial [Anaerolineae bacterium]|nr:hypothetical protein [Anaerolineae bacterium]
MMLVPAEPTRPHYAGDTYALTFPEGGPFVHLDDANGRRVAELFVLSGIHPLQGRDDTLRLGSWEVDETEDATILSLRVESSAWRRKTYRFVCRPRSFTYEVEVEGSGALAEVEYFGGYYSG